MNRETKHFLLKLPLSILSEAQNRKVHCVQVGANDGQLADPLHPFLMKHGWSGVLLEPNPVYFIRLEALYAAREDVVTLNIGASESEGEMMLYYLAEEFEELYRKNARGCATFDKQRMIAALVKERSDAADHVAEAKVPLKRLDDILAEQKVTRTDVLVIDTEGHEPSVLAGTDLAALRPKIAIVENNTSQNKPKIIKPFKDLGYQCYSHMQELVAISPDFPEVAMSSIYDAARISKIG